jgi:hypothetical protein
MISNTFMVGQGPHPTFDSEYRLGLRLTLESLN